MKKPNVGVVDSSEVPLAHELANWMSPPPASQTLRGVPAPAVVPIWIDAPRVATANPRGPVAVAAAAAPMPMPAEQWSDEELAPPPARLRRLIRPNQWIVSAYKLVGFAVLTLIVVALVGYLGANVFYTFSS